MYILLNEKNHITSYATLGGLVDGVEVPDAAMPEGFQDDWWPGKWKYTAKTGKIALSGTKKPLPPEPQPDPRDVQLAEMAQRLEEQDNALMELAVMIGGE